MRFATRSGVLIATPHEDGSLTLDFPIAPLTPVEVPDGVAEALGAEPLTTLDTGPNTGDLLIEVADQNTVPGLTPDHKALARYSERGIIVTARAEDPSQGYDFLSRCFFPNVGIDEDPVTGSAHTALAPYWSERLGRPLLTGLQASPALRPRPHRAARRPHAAHRPRDHGDRGRAPRVATHGKAVRKGRTRPSYAPFGPAHTAAQAVGSQPTFPASSAYPTNAPMSSSECATTSGPTRPHRRYR